MSSSTVRPALSDDSRITEKETAPRQGSHLLRTLCLYALAGFASVFLLSLIEWIDLNIQLTPVFESASERATLIAYSSVNLVVGCFLGFLLGVTAHLAAYVTARVKRALARGRDIGWPHRFTAALLICAAAAALLYLQPNAFRYSLGVIREAEKIPRLTYRLLRHERLVVYLVIAGLVTACTVVLNVSRNLASFPRQLRIAWLLALSLVISAAYYVDSRVEVQLYEPSLHRSMFLLEVTLSLGLIASLYSVFADRFNLRALTDYPFTRFASVTAIILLLSALAFTFVHIDKNQNLKTQIFFRSTQTEQYFRIAQWVLDFDRDGYSSLLGGGDSDDIRADISPAQVEKLGDGIDNNCIGGDLTQYDLDDWLRQQRQLNSAPNPNAKRFNVIFVFIDAARADHLSVYGYARETSPNLSRLAGRACVFDNAFTPSPYTFAAMPKFMKSCYWDAHVKTWTEVLADSGYTTILFPRRTATMLRYIKGIQRVVRDGTKGLRQTIDAAIDVLGGQPPEQPFAAFVYIPDPHRPYVRHREFDFGSSVADLYDGELAYTDFHLGRLFDWLEQSRKIDNTIVVIMADHGESLGERGVYKHTTQLYNEQARVPLLIHVPDSVARRVSSYVSTIDLGSTILNLVGVDCPKEYSGSSLLPLLKGEALAHPPVYGEQTMTEDSKYVPLDRYVYPDTKKYMVISQDGYKLIYNRDAYCFELFDLNKDPGEQHNLYDRMPDRASEMRALIGRFVDVVTVSRPADADEKKYNLGLNKAIDK